MEVKKERLQRLNELVNSQASESMSAYQDEVVKMLVEGESKKDPDVLAGYTEKNKVVNFKGPKSTIGTIIDVKIIDTRSWSLHGVMVETNVRSNDHWKYLQ